MLERPQPQRNLEPVNGVSVLERLSKLPVYFWNAKGTDPNIRHIGPTAQDFMAAFALGNDDKMIGMQDAEGVALAAIQGLNAKMQEQATTLREKDREIAELRRHLGDMESLRGELTALKAALAATRAMLAAY